MVLTFPISGDFDLLKPTRGCDQTESISAVTIAFALGTAFALKHIISARNEVKLTLLPPTKAIQKHS
jgi:hypothetical protein